MSKPRIKIFAGVWQCQSEATTSTGQSPRQAFNRWLEATIKAGLAHGGKAEAIVERPKTKPPTVRRARRSQPAPRVELDIPVFVAEPRTGNAMARPSLSLASVGLRLAGERALAAQPKTPSLSGGRRGGE